MFQLRRAHGSGSTLATLLAAAAIAAGVSACGGSDSAATSAAQNGQIARVSPPTIGGTPATTATVGQAYAFTPTASDPSGLVPTFTISGQPSWASFNSTTGKLSGTPGAANVGSSSITITATDANGQAPLSFTLTVAAAAAPPPAATGSATLTWTAPTTNTDGSALTDLAGFHVYYGTDQTNLATEAVVSGATTTSTVVSSLATGNTWYFAVTAVDNSGNESARTAVVSKSL
jgi:hypothetical protein